jgi:glycerate-2-kinase
VVTRLQQGIKGMIPETPKPGDEVFAHIQNIVIGSNLLALNATATAARHLGFEPQIFDDPLSGDTTTTARSFARQLRQILQTSHTPVCILAGGETTVSVTGSGKGGRNQEFALVVAQELHGQPDWTLLSAGTDGIDGPTDAAGAFVDGQTVTRARKLGLDPVAALRANDTYPFFSALGDLFRPGQTGTNVMDIKIAILFPAG